ncbi:MAG: DUF4062 domain-containing protein, partial [Thermodesulfobacteriota bacterium]
MDTSTTCKIFIASPGELAEERKLFPDIIDHLNKMMRSRLGRCILEPVGWEDALPGAGRPQELINEDVRNCDIFVMLLWKKWGTPTGEYTSGTEEEYNIAMERFDETKEPHILLYFRTPPDVMMGDPGDDLKKVLEFRATVEAEKKCLFTEYTGPGKWKELLMIHISNWLDRKVYGEDFGSAKEDIAIEIPEEIKERLQELEKEAEKNAKELKTAQAKLREEAIECAIKAVKHSEEGEFTLAEEAFAKSLNLYEEPTVLNAYGLFLCQKGFLRRAEEKFKRILVVTNDKKWKTSAYGNLGLIYYTRGDL